MTSRVRQAAAVLLVVALVSTVVVAPVAAAAPSYSSTSKVSPAGQRLSSLFAGFQGTQTQYQEGPGTVVWIKDGTLTSLRDWANNNDDHAIKRVTNASGPTTRVTVAAPWPAIVGGLTTDEMHLFGASPSVPKWYGGGLKARSYVVAVTPELVVGNADPVDLRNASTYKGHATSNLFGTSRTKLNQRGVAWGEDINKTTLQPVRTAVGADDLAASVNGSGVTVGIVDAAINIQNASSSPRFQDRVQACYNFVTNESGCDAVGGSKTHGGWVTSAIAADPQPSVNGEPYEGLAPEASILYARALGSDGSGSASDIAAAIRWLAQGPDDEWDTGDEADVIAMSLGSPIWSPTITAAIQTALDHGVTAVVVAAGNSRMYRGPARYINSPADAPGVIAVAATNTSVANGDVVANTTASAYFSSVGNDGGVVDRSGLKTRGEGPDIAAPGTAISARVYDTQGYAYNRTLSGTSMAQPVVAGGITLLLDATPSLINETARVRSRLNRSATRLPMAGVTEAGHGLLDVAAAINNVTRDRTQLEVRNEPAQRRDAYNRNIEELDLLPFAAAPATRGTA